MPSPGGAASSAARGRGIATARSKRSRSARESFSRYAASRCGLHRHSTAGSPRAPHGHMFIVPTSWKRAGKSAVPADARDGDHAVLERLPERLEHRARELGQLVEQQDPAMRERDLTRARARASADDGGRRRAVVRSAERRHGDQRARRREQPADRVDPRHLERLLAPKRRQDPRQPAREHRLARAGRPLEQEVVRARRGDLERTASPLLPADVGEIGNGRSPRAPRPRAGRTAERRSRRAGTRPPRRDAGRESARRPRVRPREPTRRRRRRARARPGERLPRRRAFPRPAECARPARARRRPRAEPGAREEAGAWRREPPARWGGRSPSPPCAAPPERGSR